MSIYANIISLTSSSAINRCQSLAMQTNHWRQAVADVFNLPFDACGGQDLLFHGTTHDSLVDWWHDSQVRYRHCFCQFCSGWIVSSEHKEAASCVLSTGSDWHWGVFQNELTVRRFILWGWQMTACCGGMSCVSQNESPKKRKVNTKVKTLSIASHRCASVQRSVQLPSRPPSRSADATQPEVWTRSAASSTWSMIVVVNLAYWQVFTGRKEVITDQRTSVTLQVTYTSETKRYLITRNLRTPQCKNLSCIMFRETAVFFSV